MTNCFADAIKDCTKRVLTTHVLQMHAAKGATKGSLSQVRSPSHPFSSLLIPSHPFGSLRILSGPWHSLRCPLMPSDAL